LRAPTDFQRKKKTVNTNYLNWLLIGFLTLGGATLTGCGDDDGPLENAAEEIDDSAEDLGEEVDEAVSN